MGLLNSKEEKKEGAGPALIAVAIDKDKKDSQTLRWAINNLPQQGQTILLLRVKIKPSLFAQSPTNSRSNPYSEEQVVCEDPDRRTKILFLPFSIFCLRHNIQTKTIVLEDTDVAKALGEYSSRAAIKHLVVGASSKSGFFRFRQSDIPSSVMKLAPHFCNVYVINKGKPYSSRSATRPAPAISTVYPL